MNGHRNPWSARIAWAVLLLLVGGAAAIWSLGRWPDAARFFAVAPDAPPPRPLQLVRHDPPPPVAAPPATREINALSQRLDGIEQDRQALASSADRADALMLAFAARRAVERGVPLGYLEPLLVRRFGRSQPAAVAGLVRFSRAPVTRADLASGFDVIAPALGSGAADQSWLSRLRGSMADIISIRREDQPGRHQAARVARARQALADGRVELAMAEVLRTRAAGTTARDWLAAARRYIEASRALDAIEAAALVGPGPAS